MHHPGVGSLLDDAGDDVALASAELAQHLVVADVAQALVDDLLRGEGGDAAEVVGAVDRLADDLVVLVALGQVDRDVAALAVEFGACTGLRGLAGVLEVRREDRLLDDLNQFVEGDLSLALHEPQYGEVDVHEGLRYSDLSAPARYSGCDRPLYRSGGGGRTTHGPAKTLGVGAGRHPGRLRTCPTRAPSSTTSTASTSAR